MGHYISCEADPNPDHTCDVLHFPMQCYYDNLGTTETRYECWMSQYQLGLRVVLPLVLSTLLLIIIYLLYGFYELRRVRLSQIPNQFNPLISYEYGKYAANAPEGQYTFQRDILPFISPGCWKRCCMVDGIDIKIMWAVGTILLLLALILIPLGSWTRTSDTNPDLIFSDTYRLGTAGGVCCFFGFVMCFLTCVLRSCSYWRIERENKMNELVAEGGFAGITIVQATPIPVVAYQAGPYHAMPPQQQYMPPQQQYANYAPMPSQQGNTTAY